MDENSVVVGIDLGTTNSCAAVYTGGTIDVLDNDKGDRITPSQVYFPEKKAVAIGFYAKLMAINGKSEYGVNEIKRLIGRKFDDPKVKNNLQYLSYSVENDGDNNEPIIVIKHSQNTIKKTPVQLCSLILTKIRTDIQNKLGKGQGTNAVITVPAYFNISQREATLKSAQDAGFTVLKLLNEPTAAAFKYFFQNKHQIKENDYFMVYDLGGGTFDIAVLKGVENNIEIVGVDGDSHLGGHDLDNIIMDFVCGHLMKNYKIDPKSDKKYIRRLRNHCEEAKHALTTLEETDIELEMFAPAHPHITIKLSREQFENLADDFITKTMTIVTNCLNSCNLSIKEIKKIILAGGCTRIPKIKKLLSDYFGEDRVDKNLHPDECVAEGAAIQAALYSKNPRQKLDVIKITDVTPLSLGIKDFVNIMEFNIKRSTPIPTSATTSRVTVFDQQKQLKLSIFEGERTDARKNRHLGDITVEDLTPAPPGQCEVSVTLSIDESGILTVTAKEKHKNNTKNLKIVHTRGHASDAEVNNAVKDAEDNKEEDIRFLKFAKEKKDLFKYCLRVKQTISDQNLMTSHKEIFDLCMKTQLEGFKIEVNDEAKLHQLFNVLKAKCKNLNVK